MDVAMIDVLQRATSQDLNVLKSAEETLKQWEIERGFYISLYNVFSNHSLAVNVRWMAIICFKNGIDRYWRRSAPNAIAEEEKEFLRQHLIASFGEPVNQLAIQLANSIAKIARYDCPREWSTLIPTLLDAVRGQGTLSQHRALLTLQHVVKTLATKCLPPDVQLFRELTMNIFSAILHLWNNCTDSFLILASNGAPTNQIQESLEKALLLLKILRKLTLHGFSKPSESPDVMSFLKIIFSRASECLECRKTLISRGIETPLCEKFIILLTKVLMGVLEMHPNCYIELIPMSLEFAVFLCFTEAGQPLIFERLVVQCFNLMKNIITCRYSRSSQSIHKDTLSNRDTKGISEIRTQAWEEFFSSEMLTEICSKLVTHYFLLAPPDLDSWNSDPKNYVSVVDDNYESCKYNLRPCMESLFLTIFHRFCDVLIPVLVKLMQRYHQPVDPNDLHTILLKDAVYNAVGLVAFELYDEVDFDQWFSTTLKEEIRNRSHNYRIIRRRICWLIGQWTSVRLSAELRPDLYQLMIDILDSDDDLSVRLAASSALKVAIDDFYFNPKEFSPYLGRAFSLVFGLLKEVDECYAKIHILCVLSNMIEHVGSEVIPHVGVLIPYLPQLWQHSEEHDMLRYAIISILIELEKAFGPESVVIEPFVVAVIAVCCDINQDGYVYLLDDGLALWLALLENTTAPTQAILDLTKNLPLLLEQSYEYLNICFEIIQMYIILCPDEFLSQSGAVIFETLRSIFGDLCQDKAVRTMVVFEQCLCSSPHGAELMKPVLLTIFENMCKGDVHASVMTMYFSIVARVLWMYKDIFVQIVSELTRKLGGNEHGEETVLLTLVQVWVDRMPFVTQLERRKLLAVALCSFLEANTPPSVLQYFPQIIDNIVGTLNDITKFVDEESENMGYAIESMSISGQSEQQRQYDMSGTKKKNWQPLKITFGDPLCSVSLKGTLQNRLQSLRSMLGGNHFNQLMSGLRPELENELKLYVSL